MDDLKVREFSRRVFFPFKKVQDRSRWLKRLKSPNSGNELYILKATKRFLGGGFSIIFGIFTPNVGGNDPI